MILIYTEDISERLSFICNQLLKHVLGCKYKITNSIETYNAAENACICYAKDYIGKGIHIVPCGILKDGDYTSYSPTVSKWNDLPVFFQTKGDLPFDILGASFYLLSRYEEYNHERTDKHGRYPAEDSLAYRNGFLEQPIADQWALELKKIIIEKWPETEFKSPHFKFIPTIDVDNVYAYRYHGILQTLFCCIRDFLSGKGNLAKFRLSTTLRITYDPFFNLEKIIRYHKESTTFPIIFFHCGTIGKHDKRTIIPSWQYKKLRNKIHDIFYVGLHPSYRAARNKFFFKCEKFALKQSIHEKSISHNRFHYLRFTLPESYEMLAHEKFRTDWSMCYSNDPGFRAGTSFPFHFYNLKKEMTYKLMIYPTAVMDKTLKSNKGLSPEESKKYILNMAKNVAAVNGHFIMLFHNEHLTDAFEWKGWKKIYKEILFEIQNMSKNHISN